MWCKAKDKHISTYFCWPFEYGAKHQVLQLSPKSSPMLPLAIAALRSTLYQIGMVTNTFKGGAWEAIQEKHCCRRGIATCLSTWIKLSQTERDYLWGGGYWWASISQTSAEQKGTHNHMEAKPDTYDRIEPWILLSAWKFSWLIPFSFSIFSLNSLSFLLCIIVFFLVLADAASSVLCFLAFCSLLSDVTPPDAVSTVCSLYDGAV